MNWFLLHVKLNEEENVAKIFREMSIEAYCRPAELGTHRDSKSGTGCIYVKLPQKYRGIVFGIPNEIGFITSQGKPILATDDEIKIVERNTIQNYQAI